MLNTTMVVAAQCSLGAALGKQDGEIAVSVFFTLHEGMKLGLEFKKAILCFYPVLQSH